MSGRRGLSIRTVVGADAAAVAELLAATGCPVAASVLAGRLAVLGAGTGTVLAAWEWGPPSGLIVVHWYATLLGALQTAQVDLLVVGPQERRRGVGRLLVKAASQAARVAGCGAIDLPVAGCDEETAGFCLATGFVDQGRRFSRKLRKEARPHG